jgi:hypothetical protein
MPPPSKARLRLEHLETRELPSVAAVVVESFDAVAAPALPAGWLQWSSSGINAYSTAAGKTASGANALVSNAPSNVTARAWKDDTLPADGLVRANVLADSLIPTQLFLRGQNLNTSAPTYYAVSVVRGLQIELTRVVNGATVSLGTLESGAYLSNAWARVTLTATGKRLTVEVYRADTGQTLDAKGNWVTGPANALDVTDGTIAAGGKAGIARPAKYAGPADVDDFATIPQQASVQAGALRESFDAVPAGGLPAGWSRWSSDGTPGLGTSATKAVAGQGLDSITTANRTSRVWNNTALPADVNASAAVFVDSLVPSQVFVRGAHLNGAVPTYYAVSVTRGSNIALLRVQNGVSTTLATTWPSVYTNGLWLNLSLAAQGSHLQVRVQRLDTGLWLNSFGDWQDGPAAALDVTDNIITAGGQTGLARPASYAGSVSFDNFAATTDIGHFIAPALQLTLPANTPLSSAVRLLVTASDPAGVSRVQYYVDNTLVVDRTPTIPLLWNLDTRNFANGAHTLMVFAFDTAGNVAVARQKVTFANAALITPTIPQHYTHIRVAALAYNGNPMGTTEQQLLQKSIDLVVPSTTLLEKVDSVSPNTPQLIYTNVSNLYQDLLTDWLNYADANGLSRETAFYHVAQATPFNGTSSSAQPVNWFWNVQLGPTSGSSAFTKLTGPARDATAGDIHFGAAGQALYLGYTEKFRDINFALAASKQSGWTYAVEYPTAVDANGNPTAWKTLTLTADTTGGLMKSGQWTFDPPKDWVTAAVPGSSARLYYIRVRTISGTAAAAPAATTVLGRDYVNAKGGTSGTIPAFDSTADKNGDGYLDDTEYASRRAGMDARFAYEGRLFYPYYGQMRFVTNPNSAAVAAWAASYDQRLLAANPLADGIFMDNSSGKNPVTGLKLLESSTTYTPDYAALLGTVSRALAPKWVMANTSNGVTETDQVVRQVAAAMEEFAMRALSGTWSQFTDLAATVSRRLADSTAGTVVIDSLSTGGAMIDPRTQMATLAEYYLVGDPKRTFLMLWGGEEPASKWSRHWFNAVATDVGQPKGTYSVFATGKDPANTNLTFNVYARQYDKALVLFKPLSYALGKGTGTTDDTTATTHPLGGSYRVLNADGTLGPVVTSITLRNGEGAVLIKV